MKKKVCLTCLLLLGLSLATPVRGVNVSNEKFPEVPVDSVSGLLHDTLRNITLREVVIVKKLNHLNEISKVDLKINPMSSSQEVLRFVPGLFIAQHAGGGKAEQMFLRGFDLDHGTDINVSVDGMPVNMFHTPTGRNMPTCIFFSRKP
ncbi:MAG: Plug domain-containing protein [Bacteroides sp.]|nr:Plug domain-containing protein [Bacteroides sp.]